MKKVLIVIFIILLVVVGFTLVYKTGTLSYLSQSYSKVKLNIVKSNKSLDIITPEQAIKGIAKKLELDDTNMSCDEIKDDPNYYMVSWPNPGRGTGGTWYVDKRNGNVYSFNHEKVLFNIKKQ